MAGTPLCRRLSDRLVKVKNQCLRLRLAGLGLTPVCIARRFLATVAETHHAAAAYNAARGHRCLMAEPFDELFGVIAQAELADDLPRLGKALEAMEIESGRR